MRNALIIIVALAVLAGLFVWLRPAAPSATVAAAAPAARPDPAAPAAASEPAAAAVPAARQFELRIAGGQRVEGPAVLAVGEGETVILRVVSDAAEEFHLHGYDLKLELQPNLPVTLEFRADRTGRFEYELERAGVHLGALEVRPR